MTYPESQTILSTIQNAQNILLNVHRNPDLDTVGSSMALKEVLESLGKKVTVFCPSVVEKSYSFIKGVRDIQTVDFHSFDFKPYDLFLILDSGSWQIVSNTKDTQPPQIPIINIDHHRTNEFSNVLLRLLDTQACATAEIVYSLLTDWDVKMTKNIATALFSAIAGDTVFFKYGDEPKRAFAVAQKLIELGADKDLLVATYFDSQDFNFVKMLGLFLSKIEKDEENKFVWAAVPYDDYIRLGKQRGAREAAADSFFRSVEGYKFGIAMLETDKGILHISFRSKPGVDVSVLAKKLGGGGHAQAAGATVEDKFSKAVEKVLKVARK